MSKQPQGFWPQAFEEVITQNDPLSICIEGKAAGSAPNITPDYIRVESIEGKEAISQPFSMTVQLRADDVYDKGQIAPQTMLDDSTLGCWACVKLSVPSNTAAMNNTDKSEGEFEQTPRYFRGIITELSMADPGCYTLTLASPLHLLTLQNRYHIYQGKNIAELITELLSPYKLTLQTDKITGVTAARNQDWLQAGETDMEFLQRIIGKAAIHYYFIHQEKKLTLVFSNTTSSTDTVAIPGHNSGPIPLRYTYTNIEALGQQQNDLFCGVRYSVKMMPKINNTLLTTVPPVWTSNTIAPPINTYGNLESKAQSTNEQGGYFLHRYYDYGAAASNPQQRIAIEEDEATRQLETLQQQVATSAGTLTGSVTTPLLGAGYAFTLENPLIKENAKGERVAIGRPEFKGKHFVVTQIHHKMSGDHAYSGTVEATEITRTTEVSQHTFLTPFSMQGTHQGSVVARVVADRQGEGESKGWRFNDKTNFGLTTNSVGYSEQSSTDSIAQKGVTVELATGQRCWVLLSATSQTIPEVGAVVMIGRSSNQSEQPELQQVLSSHGSKNIQPVDDGFSWRANTNWGSSYSVNYGNSVSLSQGSFSMGHSETGKSVNVSITGQGDGLTDPASDYQAIKKISDSLSTGDSYNKSHTKGKSINLSGTGAPPPDFLDTPGLVSYSNSKTIGAVVNNSVTIGAVSSNNVTVGATSNITTNTGAVNNVTNNNGLINNVTVTTGITTTLDTFVGRKFEKQIHLDGKNNDVVHSGLHEISEKNLAGKTERIFTIGLNKKTVSTEGDMTLSELVNGDKNSTLTTDGALVLDEEVTGDNTQTFTNSGAVSKTITNSGAVTINEKTEGAREVNITNSGVSNLNTSYVGEANITTSFAAPPTISYTGSPCTVTMAGLNLTVEPEMTVTTPELTVSAGTSMEVTTPELTVTAATSMELTTPELTITAAASMELTTPELTVTAAASMELTSPDMTISSPALTVDAAEVTFTSGMMMVM